MSSNAMISSKQVLNTRFKYYESLIFWAEIHLQWVIINSHKQCQVGLIAQLAGTVIKEADNGQLSTVKR